jgi:iron complex outermembrane receptor protein
VALIDGRLTHTQAGLNDGKRALGVPNLNVNLGAEVDLPFVPGLTLNGRVIHVSEQFVNAANTQVLPDWTRVDLGARYTFLSPWNGKPIVIRANVENVANKGYWASAYNGVVTVGAPRTYLLSTTFNF